MSSRAVSILGCGWLGLPLAKHFVALGYQVKGSTTTPAKLRIFENSGIQPFLLDVQPHIHGQNVHDFFESDILFLNIPFKRHLSDPVTYQYQIESVVEKVRQSSIRFVVFASSTSIYPDDIGQVTEETVFQPRNPRANVLWVIEKMLLDQKEFQSTIIRFGGLYGKERRLGQLIYQKKGNVPDHIDSPVNLIHQDDCLEIVTRIMEADIRNEIINAVSDGHPSRRELYVKAALKSGIPLSKLNHSATPRNKIVINAKLKRLLSYQFKYPEPLEAVDQL